MPLTELEDLEIQLLLAGVHHYYGFDFRDYAIGAIKQRILAFIQADQLSSISYLQEKILHDPAYMQRFLLKLSAVSTSMFPDPTFYRAFKEQVVPLLQTYPFIRIWHVGCATGEEVYSMAILLWEAGIYSRCRIYATDLNEAVVLKAKAGIFSLNQIKTYTSLYRQAGGEQQLSDYYAVNYDRAIIHSSLKEHIVFATHNLATDASFNEFNVIICRNLLSSFNAQLQFRVHQLFHDSLRQFGILAFGEQDTLRFSPYQQHYKPMETNQHFYCRVA